MESQGAIGHDSDRIEICSLNAAWTFAVFVGTRQARYTAMQAGIYSENSPKGNDRGRIPQAPPCRRG